MRATAKELTLSVVKATATYRSRLTDNIKRIGKAADVPVSYELVYGGDEALEVGEVKVKPWFLAGAY